MGFTKQKDAKRDRLADEIAELTTQVKALRKERAATAQVTDLEREVERLKLEKANLVEENDRKIRETEHKVGLLKKTQDQDVAHARRMAVIEVREENVSKAEERFKAEMEFQRKHLQGEIDRFDGIAKALMDRLPVIDVSLGGQVGATARKPAARKAGAGRAAEE